MRRLAPALLLLMTSCGQGGPSANQPADQPGPQRTAEPGAASPTGIIAIAASGPGGCEASWDGRPVTPVQIRQRSAALLEQAFAAAGGIANITDETLPVADVQAPADLGMACAETVLLALQRSGMASVRLGLTDGQGPALMDFPLNMDAPPPPVPMVLGLGAGGRLTWNGDPIDQAGLTERLTRIGGSAEAPNPMEPEPPPGGLELRVAREATVGQLHQLLRTATRYQIRPFVYLPSAAPGPGGAPVASPPPLPPAPPPVPPAPPPPPGR